MRVDYANTAVITWATSGINRSIAVALAKKKWKTGIIDMDMAGAEEMKSMLEMAGGEAMVFEADVRKAEDLKAAAKRFFGAWGEVGMLVNSAGISGGGYMGHSRKRLEGGGGYRPLGRGSRA